MHENYGNYMSTEFINKEAQQIKTLSIIGHIKVCRKSKPDTTTMFSNRQGKSSPKRKPTNHLNFTIPTKIKLQEIYCQLHR